MYFCVKTYGNLPSKAGCKVRALALTATFTVFDAEKKLQVLILLRLIYAGTHLTQIAVSKISSTSKASLILEIVRSYLKKKEKVRSSPDEQSAFKSRSVFPVDDFYIIMKTNSSLIFNEFPLV